MWTPLSSTTAASIPPNTRSSSSSSSSSSKSSSTWSVKGLVSTGLIASLALLPWTVDAQLQCQQYGADTFRVGSMIKFFWTDAGGETIPSFNIDLYCYESNKYIQTVATVDTATMVSPQSWVVEQSIMNNKDECTFNQYQGRFSWNSTNAETGAQTTQNAICKTMLLVGPGVVTPPGQATPQDPQQPSNPEDDLPTGQIEITDKTKKIIIGVGCAVGALVLAGLVGFYYIRFKNRRAVEKSASRKLREPLQPDLTRPGTGPGASASHARYNELGSVTTSVAGYSPLQPPGEMVELGGMPSSSSSSSARRQSLDYRSGSPTPIASRHAAATAGSSQNSGLLAQPGGSFTSDRPPSLLTSSFTPPGEEANSPFRSNQSGRVPPPPPPAGASSKAHDHDDEERQLYEQQFQQQQFQQQQQQLQQQQHQQQLQQSYGGYQY
ncbi:hypothetical protein BGX29_003017 [Mortierella sp. GBA35]|nr:hypothetical protein BGX23_007136 [Mortierella sp. AD031]KAF9108139.1 hypothetical protein BGX29_003017 [Mortierella sp. GBA35]